MKLNVLVLSCVVGLVATAPQVLDGRAASSDLPMEHRDQQKEADTLTLLLDTILRSRTASALDEIASQVTTAFGGFVDDIGDFVVGSVKELPETIDRISEGVGQAMENGEEQVVIIVKGVRNVFNNITRDPQNVVIQTVDRVTNVVDESKTINSLKELENSLRLSLARIGATIVTNAEDIDSAVAQGIRTVTRMDNQKGKDGQSQEPNDAENEVRSL